MRKTREELVRMVCQEAGIPQENKTQGYLSKRQLLELVVALGAAKREMDVMASENNMLRAELAKEVAHGA